MNLEKIKEGYEFLIKKNEKKLAGLKSLKPLKLVHEDVDKSKRYMKTLQFYVSFAKLVQELTEVHTLYKDVANNIISDIDGSGQISPENLEDLRKLLSLEEK